MIKKLENIKIRDTRILIKELEDEKQNFKKLIKNIIKFNGNINFEINEEDIKNMDKYIDKYTNHILYNSINRIWVAILNIHSDYLNQYKHSYKSILKNENKNQNNDEETENNFIVYKNNYQKIDELYEECTNFKNKILNLQEKYNDLSKDELLIIKNLLGKNSNYRLESMIEDKKKEICDNILNKFNSDPNLTTQIVLVSLNFYSSQPEQLFPTEIKQYVNSCKNSVTIYKFSKNNQISYLCLRTEPDSHSTLYCRNSVRKAIRDVFKYLPNLYYLDNIIDSKIDLQLLGSSTIRPNDISEYDNIPQNIEQLLPFDWFRFSDLFAWIPYTQLILFLNRDKSVDIIGKYFANFNIDLNKKKPSKKFREEYDKCYINKIDPQCRPKEEFISEFQKYINYRGNLQNSGIEYEYKYPNENNELYEYEYIFLSKIKLYRTILLILYFVTQKLEITDIFDKLPNEDKNILNTIFRKFDTDNIMDKIHKKLKSVSEIKISQEILDKDVYECDDNLFNHNEFCQINDVLKPIPAQNQFNCDKSKNIENKNIKLKGIVSTKKDNEMKLIETRNKTKEAHNDIDYVLKKIINNN